MSDLGAVGLPGPGTVKLVIIEIHIFFSNHPAVCGRVQVQVKVTPKSCLQLSPNVNASQKVTPKSFLLVSPNGYAATLESSNGKTYQLSCSSARQGIFQELKV